MKLMLVNDEVLTAQTMMDKMNWQEYGIDEVLLAFNAAQAKTILVQVPVDIILCDIEMPGENGIELIRWVCDSAIDSECIFLTCHANFEYAQEAIRLGCSDYILMPARYEAIGKTVQRVAERRLEQHDLTRLQQYGRQWIGEQQERAASMQGDKLTPKGIADETAEYVLAHLASSDLSVESLARRFHLNPIYFNRVFKKYMGISISQYIIKERMALAAKLIVNSSLTANTVASQVGYHNYPYFASTFKTLYGCSPSQYKEQRTTAAPDQD